MDSCLLFALISKIQKNQYKSEKLHLQNTIKDLICTKLLNLCLSHENFNTLKKFTVIIKLLLQLRNKSGKHKN